MGHRSDPEAPGEGWTAPIPEGTRIAVVGEDQVRDRVETAITDRGGELVPDVHSGAAIVVGLGERAVGTVARSNPEAAILPVAAGPRVQSVPRSGVEGAIEHLFRGDWQLVDRLLLSVPTVGDGPSRAVTDVMIATRDPATISEFTVRSAGRHVETVRADGIVVALSAGSGGYARSAGGSIVAPGTGVVSVVPIAPFVVDPNHWVLEPSELELTVTRDEAIVEIQVDGRLVGPVDPGTTVVLDRAGTIHTIVVPESRAFFHRNWKHSNG